MNTAVIFAESMINASTKRPVNHTKEPFIEHAWSIRVLHSQTEAIMIRLDYQIKATWESLQMGKSLKITGH